MEAERDVVDLYRAFLMRDRIGEEFDGTIAAVVGFGLFVQIEAPFVEGLVKLDALGDDHYEFDEETHAPGRPRHAGGSSRSAIAVKVRIENVSVPGRKIDLQLVEHTPTAPPLPEHARGGRRRADERRKPLRPAPSRKHERSGGGRNQRGGGKNGRAGGPKRGGGGGPKRRSRR